MLSAEDKCWGVRGLDNSDKPNPNLLFYYAQIVCLQLKQPRLYQLLSPLVHGKTIDFDLIWFVALKNIYINLSKYTRLNANKY